MTDISSLIWDKGPTGVLALAVILILTGRLQWRQNLNEQISLLSASWEDRLKARTAETERVVLAFDKINTANEHIIAALRDRETMLISTLKGSVDNTKSLISQQDELLELSRITPPILKALQAYNQSDGDSDDGT